MVERLKQIWGGFERETTRNLTGRGVDNIQVPQRRDWRAEEEAPARGEGPAIAAFEALKARLSAQAKRSGKRRNDGEEEAESSLVGESEAARDLIRGLKSTEARILRTERLYGGEGVKERRKLFGGKGKRGFLLF